MAEHTQAQVVRLEFDKVRKLKPRHRHLRDAVLASKKSITELVTDPFGGYPFLVQALLMPVALAENENMTLDKASDLIDVYIDKHGSIEGLTQGLVKALSAYLRVEMTPADDERNEDGTAPNAATPVAPGPTAD